MPQASNITRFLGGLLTITILLALVIRLSSCEDIYEDDLESQNCVNECVTINGRLTTEGVSQPLAKIPITITWEDRRVFNAIIRRKAVSTTDTDGTFTARFTMRPEEIDSGLFVVTYKVNESEYITFSDPTIPLYDLQPDTTVGFDYVIPRRATIVCRVNNLETLPEGSFFGTMFSYQSGMSTQGTTHFWSTNTGNELVVEVGRNQPVWVEITKIVNGVRSKTYDTLLVSASSLQYQIDASQ